MRTFSLLLLLGLLLAGPVWAQRPRWEQQIDFPGTGVYDLFGYMRTLPGGDYLVYGMGNTGRPGYPATVARYHPDGTVVFQRQGRTLWTLEQDVVSLGAAGSLLVASVPDPTVRYSPPPTLFFQRLRASGDTLPGVSYPGSIFQGIPARMLPDGDSVRVLLTASLPTGSYYALATTDTAGHLGPIRRYPNPALNNTYACDLVLTPRGGWLLAGEAFVFGTSSAHLHPCLLETDHQGRLLRQRVLTLFSATDDERVARTWHNIIKLRDGSGYVLSGWQQVGGQGNAANPRWGWLAKLDTALNVVWTYRHPPQATTYLLSASVRELPDGTLGWLAGDALGNGQTATPHLYLLRVSAQGQLLRQRRFTSQACSGITLYSWQPTPDGYGAVVTGYAVNCAATSTAAVAYTARLDSALVLATAPTASGAGSAQLWPNPATEAVTWQGAVPPGAASAELLVLNALGREVRRVAVAGWGSAVTQAVGLAGLVPGAYVVRLLVGGLPAGAPSRLLISSP